MSKKTFQRLAAAVSVGLMLVAVATPSQATHSWAGYHWARTTPEFTLKLGDNLTTADWKAHLAQSSSDWNSGNSPVLTAVVGGTSNKRCSMVAGTTQVCNGRYGNNGWLGLASINITGGVHITQGSAKMNDTYFNSATYNNPNEREHVMCQEVAHTFGLDHQSTDGSSQNSCMDYFSNTGANAGSTLSTKPNRHDFDELSLIYSHLDSTSTINQIAAEVVAMSVGPAAANRDVGDEPESWGQLVRQSANGRSSVYERHNGDGSKNVTHVYWTHEATARCPGCDHRYDR
ncbi:hypothetical protein DZC73_25420 [Albitalea terrae]|uniref:Uncharacterized protein n=2 Tax=Piscinibacter terrae TaxID=2496871 RepID=A0A3N7HIB2_9BURK|nr:hypothetical protein DZC73_25420 [Albitalea terrae]